MRPTCGFWLLFINAGVWAAPVTPEELASSLGYYADHLKTLRTTNIRAYNESSYPEAECFRLVAGARKEGMAGTTALKSGGFEVVPGARPVEGPYRTLYIITLDDAETKLCAAYRHSALISKSHEVFFRSASVRDTYARHNLSAGSQGSYVNETVAECQKTWQALSAQGVPADTPVPLGNERLTFAELKTKICDASAGNAVRSAQTAADTAAAVRKKYQAAGASGKRLDLLAEYDGLNWRLPGGGTTSDPHTLATAPVLYQWLEGADPNDSRYVIHTIRRYQFSGNSAAGVSEKIFRTVRGASPGTAVFQ